jgi:hypothetical protein
VVLLLLADFLAFHDIFEPHTVRDWMVLVASGVGSGVALVGGSVSLLRPAARRG